MKRFSIFLCVFLLGSISQAQQKRVLVGEDGEVVAVKKGENATRAIQRVMQRRTLTQTETSCASTQTFGYDTTNYPYSGLGTGLNATHKDIWGVTLQVPTDGTIDTVYAYVGSWLNKDSTLYLRIMKSNVYTPGAVVDSPGVSPYTGSDTSYFVKKTDGRGPDYYPYRDSLLGCADCDSALILLGNIVLPICWGYFSNSHDADGQANNLSPNVGGVAAFPQDATPPNDAAWNSTLALEFPRAPSSFSPAGNEIWGNGGAVPFTHLHKNGVAVMNLHTVGPLHVWAHEPIMITLEIPGVHTPSFVAGNVASDPDWRTMFTSWPGSADSVGLFHHYHLWKFYEHNSSCGVPGWVTRDSWEINVWYSMHATGNIAPSVHDQSLLRSTFSTAPRSFIAHIEDCDFGHPERAGVQSAHLGVSVDDGPVQIVSLSYVFGTTWTGTFPPVPPAETKPYYHTVQYYLAASDSEGASADSSITQAYNVLSFGNEWYSIDTTVAAGCAPLSIKDSANSHYIDTARFFTMPASYHFTKGDRRDDGTAGPFDIGGPFIFFGDTVRYAWVGVNGGISLSKTAADTIDVNASSNYAPFYWPRFQHGGPSGRPGTGRADTFYTGGNPRNFIAGFWNDLIYGDSANQYGRMFWQSNDCQFVVEWDSIPLLLNGVSQTVPSDNTFRIILNKCDGTIDFQYDRVEDTRADTLSIVGLNGDSLHVGVLPTTGGYLQVCRMQNGDNGPLATKPRDGWCMRLYPSVGAAVAAGWNLLSVPTSPQNHDFAATHIYPNANATTFFSYVPGHGYQTASTLANGTGYWMKFLKSTRVATPGIPLYSLTMNVFHGWNIIGTIAKSVPRGDVVQNPIGIIPPGQPYYYYSWGYHSATTLDPGRGYWVKAQLAAGDTGHLTLTAASIPRASPTVSDNFSTLNQIVVRDNNRGSQALYIGSDKDLKVSAEMYELPPLAPEGTFDVRFASQRMVETYPADLDAAKEFEYPISIQSSAYPITVEWNIKNVGSHSLVLTDGVGGRVLNNVVLNGSGSIRIANACVKSLVLKLVPGIAIPKQFALSQNYPNPFNSTTRFNVDLPKTTTVEINVYNILGQRIAILMDGLQSAGYHTVEWNGLSSQGLTVPSGMYVVRMNADGFSAVRKVMLLK